MTRLARIRADLTNLGWKGLDYEDGVWLLETVNILATTLKFVQTNFALDSAAIKVALARLEEPDETT